MLPQQVIGKHQGHHGFHHRHRPGQHTGVMTTLGSQCGRHASGINRLLLLADRCSRFEGHPDHDRLAVADAALDAAGVVGGGVQRAVAGGQEGVVVLAAPEVAEVSPAALGQTYPAVETFPVVDTFPAATPPATPTTTRRTRTRSTASNGAKPRTNSSPAARRMAKAATRLSIGSTTSKAASAKATPAAPIPVSYPSTVDGPAANSENPAD